jgi:hypothetical protein
MTSTTRSSFARKLASAALAVTAGLGAVAVTDSPAMAASCQLDFARVSQRVYRLLLNCGDATRVSAIALYGEDFPFDTFLGNTYQPGQLIDQGVLDEDDFPFNREDEIYGKLSVRERDGSVVDVRTNTVSRNF